jgi:hypothetical protein
MVVEKRPSLEGTTENNPWGEFAASPKSLSSPDGRNLLLSSIIPNTYKTIHPAWNYHLLKYAQINEQNNPNTGGMDVKVIYFIYLQK